MAAETLRQDLRYGFRTFRARPLPTVLGVAALALGIGVGAAIFSIVNAIILRPLPYRDSDRLVMLWAVNDREGFTEEQVRTEGRSMSTAEFLDWQEKSGIFERMVAFGSYETTITGPGDPDMAFGYAPSPGLFPLLGIRPAIGRGFLPEEERSGGQNSVVLLDSLWRRRFAADPAAIGRKIFLADRAYTIVGVMPPQFVFFNRQVEFLAAMQWNLDRMRQARDYRYLRVMARLKPGMTLRQAQARADVFSADLARQYPATNRGWTVRLSPLATDSAGPLRPALWMLMGAAGCVLLITCLNVANLLLVQVASRGKELAVRSAIGAARLRLIRQLVTESLLLAVAGGILALGLGWLLIRYFQNLLPDRYTAGKYLVQVEAIRMDPRVVAFALGVALLTGLVFGLIPAWRASKPDLNETLKDVARGSRGGRRGRRLQEILVVAEVSVALVMVVGAVLLVRSFLRLYGQPLGMRTAGVVSMQSQLPYWEVGARLQKQGLSGQALGKAWDTELRTMNDRVLEALQDLPGVRSAGLTSYPPMTGWYRRSDFAIEGRTAGAAGPPQAIPRIVSPGYFDTLAIPLLRGRLPDSHDTPDSLPVAAITGEMARRYWPGEDAIGRRLKWADAGPNDPWFTVVGIVGDVHEDGLDKPPQPIVYLPLRQQPLPVMWIVLRTRPDPASIVPAVRLALHAVHPKIPLYRIRKMDDVVLDSTWQLRYSMLLLSGLAGLSLLLAVIGVYGVLSYAVADRTREIGVRMALGAGRRDVVRLVVRRGLGLVGIGIAIGALAAAGMTRFLAVLLFGISPLDPSTFVLVALVLVASGWLACFLPAHRASRVNPAAALRHE